MKKRILSFALLLCSLIILVLPATAVVNQSERPNSFYTPINGYFYQLDTTIDESIDTFEAWVKLPESSFGGPIFTAMKKQYSWNVDVYGRFGFTWGSEEVYSFSDSPNIADGKWHHVALVRTNTEFTYYLDGEVAGVRQAETKENIKPYTYNIGSTNLYNDSTPFEGYIKQITIYQGAVSQERIKSDMNNADITTGTADAKLLANWQLGDYWTERFIDGGISGAPVAELHTFDKFFEADYSFGDYDYTIAIFPDIQIMTNFNPERLNNQIQWLIDHKEEMNVEFAMFLGDLSDYGQREHLYETAASAMSKLDNVIPYCFVPGNHDYDDNANTRNQVYFNRHFPYSKHSKLPGFAGCYEEGTMTNNYYTFEVDGGIKYLVINLEYKPRLSVLRWANIIVEAHPDHRVIMATHSYLTGEGNFSGGANVANEGNGGLTIFNELMVKHSNIFMGLGGHENNDEALHRTEYGYNGNKILSMLCDVQVSKFNDEGCLDVFMLVHVNEEKKTMNFVYYSPMHEKVYNMQGQFEISFADPLNPTIGE